MANMAHARTWTVLGRLVFAGIGGGLVTVLLATGVQAETVSLAQALARADTQGPVIAAAKARLDAAEGAARQAGAIPNPEIGMLAENIEGSGIYRSFDAAQTTYSVSQRLELGGQRQARRSEAQAQAKAAGLRLSLARAETAEAVQIRFAEALAADQRAKLAREAVTRTQALAGVVQTLVDAGREPPLRVLRARSEAAVALAQGRAAEAEAAASRRALAALWGGPGEDLQLTGDALITIQPAPLDPTAALTARIAESEAEAASAALERARRLNFPDVTVQAGVRRFEDSGQRALVVGASLPIPVWDRNRGGIAAAQALLNAAELTRLAAMADAVRYGRDAEAALAAAKARLDAAENLTIPQAHEAADLARQGYEAGKFGLLDVMDAQAALNAVQTEQLDARLALAKAQAARARLAAK